MVSTVHYCYWLPTQRKSLVNYSCWWFSTVKLLYVITFYLYNLPMINVELANHLAYISIVSMILTEYPVIENVFYFGLVWFYGISTIVDHLMSNPVYVYIIRHHHVAPSAPISLTLSRHPSLSSIASGRFWRHSVSAQSCFM